MGRSLAFVVAASSLACIACLAFGGRAAGQEDAAHAARTTRTPDVLTARREGEGETRDRDHAQALHLGEDEVLAYAPPGARRAERPVVVYLHGRHGRAENGCPWMRAGAASSGSWLVCPRGGETDAVGASSWGGDVFAQGTVVERATRAAETRGASSAPGVAVGFSQGAYVALDLVKTGRGRFRGLVLLAAPEAHPSAAKLRAAGVERVVLGAGSLDAAYAPLRADADRLASEGMPTRFLDLGAVGHTYAAEDPSVLADAIAWAAGPQKAGDLDAERDKDAT